MASTPSAHPSQLRTAAPAPALPVSPPEGVIGHPIYGHLGQVVVSHGRSRVVSLGPASGTAWGILMYNQAKAALPHLSAAERDTLSKASLLDRFGRPADRLCRSFVASEHGVAYLSSDEKTQKALAAALERLLAAMGEHPLLPGVGFERKALALDKREVPGGTAYAVKTVWVPSAPMEEFRAAFERVLRCELDVPPFYPPAQRDQFLAFAAEYKKSWSQYQ